MVLRVWHALGLIHEHQNPGTAIPWNKPNVYRVVGVSEQLGQATSITICSRRQQAKTNYTADTKSIMISDSGLVGDVCLRRR